MKISRALAEFVVGTEYANLDAKAVQQTRYALLDGLGVSLAATTLGEGCKAFREYALQQNDAGQSSVWGTGRKSSAAMAAFANGALAHALDFEDTHDASLVHPNAAVIPAALAIAEMLPTVTGRELIAAIAVGCEVVCRLGASLTVPLDQYGWYPPPILSAYGATAAVAKLLKLNSDQVLDAFSLTLLQATCSGEIKYNPDSVIRAVRDAFPAKAGVVSAQLGQLGIKGFAEPFEGKAGFFTEFARGNVDTNKLVQNLGQHFAISELSFKAWPSCRGTHVFIDRLLALMQDKKINAEDIATIDAFGNRINRMLAEPLETKRRPTTSIDAKFSIPYCLGWAAVYGEPQLHSFFEKSLSDNAVLGVAEKVTYHIDTNYKDTGSGMLSGRIRLTTLKGDSYELEGDSAPGSTSRPLSEVALVNKFTQCCQYFSAQMAGSKIHALANNILHLEQQDNLQDSLFAYLQDN